MQRTTKFPTRRLQIPDFNRAERLQAIRNLAAGKTIEIGLLQDTAREYLYRLDALEIRRPHCELKPDFRLILDEKRGTFRVEQISELPASPKPVITGGPNGDQEPDISGSTADVMEADPSPTGA